MLNNPVGFLRNFRIIHHGADKVYNITIHPFNDRNGMMSRLLTMPIPHRSGFYIGKYILEKSKDLYYDALGASQNGWHQCVSDRIGEDAQGVASNALQQSLIPRRYPRASAIPRMHTRRCRYPVRHYRI